MIRVKLEVAGPQGTPVEREEEAREIVEKLENQFLRAVHFSEGDGPIQLTLDTNGRIWNTDTIKILLPFLQTENQSSHITTVSDGVESVYVYTEVQEGKPRGNFHFNQRGRNP
jgi:hypothetical protein